MNLAETIEHQKGLLGVCSLGSMLAAFDEEGGLLLYKKLSDKYELAQKLSLAFDAYIQCHGLQKEYWQLALATNFYGFWFLTSHPAS